jgi:putative Mg2+ transporter-C (MgtC) family protein
MDFEILCQLLLATFLGALIGLEREVKERAAGLQTYSLVSLGSCIFTVITLYFFRSFGVFGVDLIRVIQAIAIGVGFIGAGAIFKGEKKVEGLTTAAGLWGVAAIGIAVGAQLYLLAIFATFLAILILAGFGKIEEKFFKE